jgi:hypothetical protein
MRFRFSILTMLLVMAIIGLGIALFMTRRELAEAQRQLSTHQPLSLAEVARQFQSQLSTPSVAVTVDDVRYSEGEKAYKVEFSWIDPASKQRWSTETKLRSDGYGKYQGTIESDEFRKALGTVGSFVVSVESPSAFR